MNIFRSFFFKHALSRFQWYRRWFGGRWEYHWIEPCHSAMWLDMHPNRCWPEWRQPCSLGTPIIEDYPLKGGAAGTATKCCLICPPCAAERGRTVVDAGYAKPARWVELTDAERTVLWANHGLFDSQIDAVEAVLRAKNGGA